MSAHKMYVIITVLILMGHTSVPVIYQLYLLRMDFIA